MIVNSRYSDRNVFKSFYVLQSFFWHNNEVHVIGADAIVQDLIKKRLLEVDAKQMTADLARSLFLEIPGQYAFVILSEERIDVVTDPCGIIKLYGYLKDDALIVVDDILELKNEHFTLDKDAVKYYFIKNYTPSKHTFFKEVFKFEPCAFYSIDSSLEIVPINYAKIQEQPLGGEAFLNEFQRILEENMSFYKKHYDKSCLFLSGGVDSSFLFRLLSSKEKNLQWFDLVVGKMDGMQQMHLIDNDYDISFSQRLAKEEGKELEVVGYDYSSAQTVTDFELLRNHLFTEYAPAMGYLGFVRAVDAHKLIVNGQNSDSILSFGLLGNPRWKGFRITGLNGLFSRYFMFFGHRSKNFFYRGIASFLRGVYYKRNYPIEVIDFSDQNYYLGLCMHPKNQYWIKNDPCFSAVEQVQELSDWFKREYLQSVFNTHKNKSSHALSMILYQKTCFQGSANRATILSSLIQGRKIFLPYTSLALFELMCNLKPDWHYAYYGKYPNIKVGRDRIGLPDYILNREDPNDCDSSILMYTALLKNKVFTEFLTSNMNQTNWILYKGILTDAMIHKIQNFENAIQPNDLATFMRFIWIDSLLRKFKVS